MEEPRKKRQKTGGRKSEFGGKGAPVLRVRLLPAIHDRVTQHPDGARRYIERLVRADVENEPPAPTP